MTKQIDQDKPLSQEDRDYLHARGEHDRVTYLDQQHGVETPEEELPPETVGMPMDVGSRRAWLAEQLRLLDEFDATGGAGLPELPEDDYDSKTVKELQSELANRELPTSGAKTQLVERLRADDIEAAREQYAEEGDEQTEA